MSSTLTIYTSPLSARHDTGEGHPENAARLKVLEPLFAPYQEGEPRAADLDEILRAHDEDYVFDLQDKTPDFGLAVLDVGDTVISPASYDAALYASGATIQAIDDLLQNDSSSERPPACGHDGLQKARAFCSIRPPGHHAEPSAAMGFCLFNHIFIAARHAQEVHGIKRIAIVDFDIHHGNGTEAMARAHNTAHPDQPILYISTHGYPLFPMTGDPAENDATTVNIRLPMLCDSKTFKDIYESQVFPVLEDFKPELLLLSAGFDAHKNDPLGAAALESADYGWLTRRLCEIADKHANGRILSVLEGGYDLDALKECVAAHLQELSA